MLPVGKGTTITGTPRSLDGPTDRGSHYCTFDMGEGVLCHPTYSARGPQNGVRGKVERDGLRLVKDTLVESTRWDRVYCATTEGITSANWSPDAKRWLHLVTGKIHPSGIRTNVTFPQALVVASTSGSKRRKTNKASSSQAVAEADAEGGEDNDGGDTLPTQSQSPVSGAWVEEDLAAVRRRLG
uniref:Uncharacterized protein n=1 Tax=Solanum tuberosum TaxID=4113 RepID=M1D8M8_SOLTU